MAIFRMGLFLTFCVVAVACTPPLPVRPDPSNLPDPRIFEDKDYRAGCWQTLCPGETSEEQVAAFFEQDLDFSNTNQGQFDDFSWLSEGSANREDEFYVEARIKDDVLSEVHLGGPFNFSISKILVEMGQPNLITTTVSNYGETLYLEAQIELHYPQYGYSFTLFYWGEPSIEDGFTPCLDPDDVIYRIQIYQATSRERYISESRNISENRVDVIDDWPGYECIEVQW